MGGEGQIKINKKTVSNNRESSSINASPSSECSELIKKLKSFGSINFINTENPFELERELKPLKEALETLQDIKGRKDNTAKNDLAVIELFNQKAQQGLNQEQSQNLKINSSNFQENLIKHRKNLLSLIELDIKILSTYKDYKNREDAHYKSDTKYSTAESARAAYNTQRKNIFHQLYPKLGSTKERSSFYSELKSYINAGINGLIKDPSSHLTTLKNELLGKVRTTKEEQSKFPYAREKNQRLSKVAKIEDALILSESELQEVEQSAQNIADRIKKVRTKEKHSPEELIDMLLQFDQSFIDHKEQSIIGAIILGNKSKISKEEQIKAISLLIIKEKNAEEYIAALSNVIKELELIYKHATDDIKKDPKFPIQDIKQSLKILNSARRVVRKKGLWSPSEIGRVFKKFYTGNKLKKKKISEIIQRYKDPKLNLHINNNIKQFFEVIKSIDIKKEISEQRKELKELLIHNRSKSIMELALGLPKIIQNQSKNSRKKDDEQTDPIIEEAAKKIMFYVIRPSIFNEAFIGLERVIKSLTELTGIRVKEEAKQFKEKLERLKISNQDLRHALEACKYAQKLMTDDGYQVDNSTDKILANSFWHKSMAKFSKYLSSYKNYKGIIEAFGYHNFLIKQIALPIATTIFAAMYLMTNGLLLNNDPEIDGPLKDLLKGIQTYQESEEQEPEQEKKQSKQGTPQVDSTKKAPIVTKSLKEDSGDIELRGTPIKDDLTIYYLDPISRKVIVRIHVFDLENDIFLLNYNNIIDSPRNWQGIQEFDKFLPKDFITTNYLPEQNNKLKKNN